MSSDEMPANFHGEFKLSVTEALRSQLISRLDALDWAPMGTSNLSALASRGGVYQLAVDGHPVYVGKSKSSLPDRLAQHHRKLSGRRLTDPADQAASRLVERVTFRCAYVDEDLDAVAPEKMLMAELGAHDQAAWNYMGFGNKDPGKNRDRSTVKEGHFDRIYPIDLDIPIPVENVAGPNLRQLMVAIKKATPFTYRFAKNPPTVPVDMPATGGKTAREWFELVASALPAGWVTVVLPGYVIAYPNLNPKDFASRTASWRSTGGSTVFETHSPSFTSGRIEVEAD